MQAPMPGGHAVAVSPDGKRVASCDAGRRLVSGGADKTARVWDVESGKEIQRFGEHTDAVTCAAFMPGGRQALTGYHDRTLRFWRVRK